MELRSRDPAALEILVGLLAFPFLGDSAIWQTSWDASFRLIAIALLAGGYTLLFVPRERNE